MPPPAAPPTPVASPSSTPAPAQATGDDTPDLVPALDTSKPAKELTPGRSLPVSGKPIPLSIVPHSGYGKPIAWNPHWRRFDGWDLAATAASGGVTLATAIIKPLPPIIHGPILFDDAVRNTLRLHTVDLRGWAGDVSDVLLSLSMMGPFLVDSLTTAWWYRGSKDVAQQMALIDMETLAITSAVHGVVADVFGRARPYTRVCGSSQLPSDSQECQTFDQNRSFFSGHSALSFASASLVCQHHLGMHLFEYAPADIMSCVGSLLTAGTTATLRIMSDNHYSTDVLMGIVEGTTFGLTLPYFLHYMPRAESKTTGMTLTVVPTGAGAAAVGTW